MDGRMALNISSADPVKVRPEFPKNLSISETKKPANK
jgi:hypothetical protein